MPAYKEYSISRLAMNPGKTWQRQQKEASVAFYRVNGKNLKQPRGERRVAGGVGGGDRATDVRVWQRSSLRKREKKKRRGRNKGLGGVKVGGW